MPLHRPSTPTGKGLHIVSNEPGVSYYLGMDELESAGVQEYRSTGVQKVDAIITYLCLCTYLANVTPIPWKYTLGICLGREVGKLYSALISNK